MQEMNGMVWKKCLCMAAVVLLLFSCIPVRALGAEVPDTGVEMENGTGRDTGQASGDDAGQDPGNSDNSESGSYSGQNLLSVDDENVYDGMGAAYRDGYVPEVSHNTAALVLPLYVDEGIELEKIRVVPDLGASDSSPFVVKNYQKTFQKTEERINGGSGQREVFLVVFDFALKSDRVNGVYPVQWTVDYTYEGVPVTQSFTSYVNITDGKSAEPAVASEPVEEKSTSEPKVIVSQCVNIPDRIESGDEFSFTVILKNTNKAKFVQNMTVTVGCEAEGLSLVADSNVFYYDYLKAGGTLEVPLSFRCSENTAAGRYHISLDMSYDNPDAVVLSSVGQIELNISQKVMMDLEVGSIPGEMNAGDSMSIPIQALNLGRGKVYNVRCSVEAAGVTTPSSLFLGDLEGGTAASGELNIFAGMVNPDGETDTERYGYTSGKIIMTYEDEGGEEQLMEKNFSVTIQPLQISGGFTEDGEDEPNVGLQLFGGILAVAAVIGAGTCGVVVWRKRRMGKMQEDEAKGM